MKIHPSLLLPAVLAAACVCAISSSRPQLTDRAESTDHARPRPVETESFCTAKPPVKLLIDANWGNAAGGSLPLSVAVTPEVESRAIRLHFVGKGAFAGWSVSRDAKGPWAAGATARFNAVAPSKGAGAGTVEVTAELLDESGKRITSRRADVFTLFENGRVWGSYSSPTDLALWRAEQLASAEGLDAEQLRADLDEVTTARVAADSTPHDLDLAPAEWRLQREFEAVAPPEPKVAKAAAVFAAAALTVSGKVQWTDRNGGLHGLPMATVEIRDDELIGSDLITTVTTDAGGNYTASFSFDDGIAQGNPDIFVRVLARSVVADIKPDTASATTYAMNSPVQNEVATGSSITINLTAGRTADNETVFGVHHALVMIGTYSGGLAGTMPSQVDVRFPTTRSTSLFDSSVTQLHILQLDRFDWDVIHHEFGHYFQNIHRFQANPGGAHSFTSNLATTRGSKDLGIRLAWGEGWPTFFGIAGQQVSGASALGVPDVGDASYQDTEDASTNLNIETSPGVGEDNEVSVMATLWDLFDTAADGVDESNFSDKNLFNLFKGATVTTIGAAWEAIAATLSNSQKASVGGVFGQSKIAPELLTPADNFNAGATPPAFTWRANGGGTPNPLNDFKIKFYDSNLNTVAFEKSLGNVTTFTPTAAEWTTILGAGDIVKWVVEGKNTGAPATPGGALERYWSRARTLGGISIAFVIDDTGSMGEEIAGVRNSLQTYIGEVEARLAPGAKPPTIQLVTFKDNVSTRVTSNDLVTVRTAVGSLFASGGGDCPEAGAQALQVAVDNIAPGGTILFATDASSQPGIDIGALISRARAKGATVNTLLSGDCSGISSLSVAAAAPGDSLAVPGWQESDDSAALPPVTYLEAGSTETVPDFIQKPGANDPPQTNIIDLGQPPADEAGNTAATAAQLIVGDSPIRGIIGLADDTEDFYAVRLKAGEPYVFRFQLEAGSGATFALLDMDGTSVLRSQNAFGTTPSQFLFSPTADGDHFIRVTGSNTTFYLLRAAIDPFASLTSAIQMFSTISAQTGGAFIVRDDVNSGNSTAYEAALLNIMLATLEPVVLLANPGDIQQGTSLSVELTGNGTNWRTGTSVSFPEGGITVNSVEVLSATRLRVQVTVSSTSSTGFQNVIVSTPLGSNTETATGRDLVEVVPANPNPAILSVEPATLSQGDSVTVAIRGINTAWNSTATVNLGSGITVDSISVMSATLIEASITVNPAAAIGFRTARVTVDGGSASKTRALFISSGISALPEIVRITPALGVRGETLDVTVAGINTGFISGVTTASFNDGIRVLSVNVISPTSVVVRIRIAGAAEIGFRNVSLDTGGEVAVLLNGFFVDEFSEVVIPLPANGKAKGCLVAGQRAIYSFGQKKPGGRVDLLLAADRGSRYMPKLTLLDPDGRAVLEEAAAEVLDLKGIKLKKSGTYRVLVSDADSRAGCFSLRVRDSKAGEKGIPFPASGILKAQLAPGGTKTFTHKAGAGDLLRIGVFEDKMPPGAKRIAPLISVLDADGKVVTRKTLGKTKGSFSVRLPKDGRFSIVFKNNGGSDGRFAFKAKVVKRKLPPWLRF